MTTPRSSELPDALLRGVAASPGVALGPVFVYAPEPLLAAAPTRPARSAAEEKAALQQALA